SSPAGPESSIDQITLQDVSLNIRVFTIQIMDGLDTSDGARFTANQQRFGGRHVAFTGDPIQQIAFSDTGGGENNVVAARHFIQRQDFIGFDAHLFTACQLFFTDTAVLFSVALNVVTRQ